VDVYLKAFDVTLGETVHHTCAYSSDVIDVGCEWVDPYIVPPKAATDDAKLFVTIDAALMSEVHVLSSNEHHKVTRTLSKNRASRFERLRLENKRNQDKNGTTKLYNRKLGGELDTSLPAPHSPSQKPIAAPSQTPPGLNTMSPVSALTSPTYTPPSSKRKGTGADTMNLFKMSADKDFSDPVAPPKTQKKGAFSSLFSKRTTSS
jgi:hypothetical protein